MVQVTNCTALLRAASNKMIVTVVNSSLRVQGVHTCTGAECSGVQCSASRGREGEGEEPARHIGALSLAPLCFLFYP